METLTDTPDYRITRHPTISRQCPVALDIKTKTDGRIRLINVGWYRTYTDALNALGE